MFIEFLEPRIAPAGLIDVIISGKSLIIKDTTGDDSTLEIEGSTTGSITITPDAATGLRVNGSVLTVGNSFTQPFFAGSVSVGMAGGADTLTLGGHFSGPVKVDLGADNNFINFDSASISGAVTVKGGPQDDGIQFLGNNTFLSQTLEMGETLHLAVFRRSP
jgi:hypothetical protein